MTKLIYVASPYTALDGNDKLAILQERFEKVIDFLAYAIDTYEDRAFYSPIVHWHMAALKHDMPVSVDFWRTQNEALMRVCNELWVLRLEGWKKSYGVAAEISFMRALNKPIFYVG